MSDTETRPTLPARWSQPAGAAQAGGVWTEAVPGRGEDAEPLFVHHVPDDHGIIAVFDGTGGAGSSSAYRSSDGTTRTGAWLAARVTRIALESWFGRSLQQGTGFDVGALENRLSELLTAMRPAKPPRTIGRLHKELPTTLAAVHYRVRGGRADCRVLWAGDSRVYLLSPDNGLQALSRDHTDEEDGLVQLLQDPPLTNVICASEPFFVQEHGMIFELPAVLLCATDGFFGYVQTPAHFEYRLLAMLEEADSMADWARRLGDDVTGYAADDASLSMVALTYPDFGTVKSAFTDRKASLEKHYWRDRPRDSAGTAGPAAEETDRAPEQKWRQKTWESYRGGYERLMAPVREREYETRRHDQRLPGDHPAG